MLTQKTFLECFDRQCIEHPDAIALCHDDRSVSYAQLSELSDRAVTALLSQGVTAGAGVGLLSGRSLSLIATMIACFRVGAHFVPLDPAFPAMRLQYMVSDASVVCMIIEDTLSQPEVSWIDSQVVSQIALSEISGYEPCSESQRHAPARSESAYIMYTSGSTGQPKGVVISQGALACYCHADIAVYKLCREDRTLQFSTLSFDIAIEEIFPSLMIGATVVLRPTARGDAQIELSDMIERHAISAVHLATGYWHEWVDLMLAANVPVPACLRLMVVTGDKVSVEHYERWKTLETISTLWANAYGPTETTVSSTVFIPPPDWDEKTLPIGKPLPGYTAYILDDAGMPVAEGELGELYIGGGALADGYLNKPLLTDQVFVHDPFSNSDNDQDSLSGQRMYRTGDLARWRKDGNIQCSGRIDHQIKVGGYRVEPGEVESVLNAYPGVNEVLVQGEEVNSTVFLTAYLATDDTDFSLRKLVASAAQQLPGIMLPTRYAVLNKLPKTVNGKVDRAALSLINAAPVLSADNYVPPTTDMESALCKIWSEVLGVSRVGIHDSFISLGGNSLMAVKVIARLHADIGIVLSTRDFFFLDSVHLLASHLDGRTVKRQVPSPQPSFINTRNRQIYTLLQKPDSQRDIGRGILLVPPLGNEQRRVQRPLRNFMQNLSRMGYTLMRFDWQGTGNSSGDSRCLDSIDVWESDVIDAAHALSDHVASIDLVAFRAGALIAANTDLGDLPVGNRFYLDPVFDGANWLTELELLHSAIREDTYRFLKPRKAREDAFSEYAGLVLNQAMKESIAERKLPALLHANRWGCESHIIRANTNIAYDISTSCSQLHEVDDVNDWVSPRTTTDDMRINDAAALVTDILLAVDAQQRPQHLTGS